MSKFTPGPWETLGPEGYPCKVYAGDMNICDIRGWGYLTGVGGLKLSDDKAAEIQDANAHLIACAPQLYNIACRCAEYLRSTPWDTQTCLYDDLVAVIAKAEGTAANAPTAPKRQETAL